MSTISSTAPAPASVANPKKAARRPKVTPPEVKAADVEVKPSDPRTPGRRGADPKAALKEKLAHDVAEFFRTLKAYNDAKDQRPFVMVKDVEAHEKTIEAACERHQKDERELKDSLKALTGRYNRDLYPDCSGDRQVYKCVVVGSKVIAAEPLDGPLYFDIVAVIDPQEISPEEDPDNWPDDEEAAPEAE